MRSAIVRTLLAAAIVCAAAGPSLAQPTTATATAVKAFEVLAVEGNTLVVSLPEGTRELKVADDFRFTVDGKQLSVHQLKPGMKGTATITTRTTTTPVTVTEIKDGTVAMQTGSSIIVRTDEGFKSFTQGDIDKRGVQIIRNGKPAKVSDFRQGDKLSATIITSLPPKVVTEQEVNATLARTSTGSPAAAKSAPATKTAAAGGASGGTSGGTMAKSSGSGAAAGGGAKTLPKTASQLPLLGLLSVLSLGMGFALTLRRRFVS
jgi:hypothetical protein